MAITPSEGSRRERHDTKTLVRLGTDARESGPVPKPPERSEPEALEDGGRRPNVQLWFQGVRGPVRACAELGETELSLDAPLPFLELESVVGCMTEDGALVHGRIRHVELEAEGAQGVPRLRVAVELDDGLGADDADEVYVVLPVEPPEPAEPAEPAPVLTSAGRARPSPLPLLAALLVGLAAGAGATYGWAREQARALRPAAAIASPSPARVVHPETAPGERIEPPSIVIALAAAQLDELARSRAAQWRLERGPLARFSVTPPRPLEPAEQAASTADEAEPTPPPEVALEPAPVATAGQAERDDRGFLQVSAADMQTRVFVPMRGTSEGLRSYTLTTPGIAITLPNAVALSPLENYAIARGLVRRVWLRRDRDGIQVRVITRRPASHVSTIFDQDGLTVVLDM